tara:strand:- start:1104 stop:1352 length:249 start_codon:yes stop_codon:yes gene_type:complete
MLLAVNSVISEAFVTNPPMKKDIQLNYQNLDKEMCEVLILNSVATTTSLRLMDKVFIPERECNFIKGMIVLSSGFVVGCICL